MIQLHSPILREIGALSRTIHAISDVKLKEHHLQKGQFIFLTRICENPGISLIQLSILLKVDKTTTTKAIQKLIGKGYAMKENHETDKRVYSLSPTEKGLEIYNAVIEEENKNIQICFQDFTEKERVLVYELVKKMRENIDTSWCELKKY
ncbi:MarR family winged helix-turn-helix transcriptional regulator [Sinanaerobacter chloroacetimidivorans]|uniref:MarR family transcriptional regulator n=1 Tax=Sinanaerobacter chloroacetimidivorans TaxID=2818044 RepID=A0A8J8B1T0_9FIRM|nr:MarR family transcriptional regulator [Sinanaerobacter chloroacetimidivorans]MBR0599018.1 MarR family transcriptional regulator [Sinanaerobacter chloroacetimidivorans]